MAWVGGTWEQAWPLFRGQGETPSAPLCLAKRRLCLRLALLPSAAWRGVEAELGEAAMCPDGRGSRNPRKRPGPRGFEGCG